MFGRKFSRPEVYEFWALATYNAERSRGIVHSKEWQEQMAEEQRRFDAQRTSTVKPSNNQPGPGKETL